MSGRIRALDIQASMKRVGVIRLGDQKPDDNKPGKRLSTFRLTSSNKFTLLAVAKLYGGEVKPWPGGAQQWQVVTQAQELPIEISPVGVSVQYELWAQVGGKGGKQCIRRCDSCNILEGVERGNPCVCPKDPVERSRASKQSGSKVCQLATRIFVRLPEVPDVGLWQVTTGSYYAAKEVPALMDGIEALAELGAHIRARLAIEVRKGGGNTFPVVVVRLNQSNDELRALATTHFEKLKAIEGTHDKQALIAFKLGLPITVVDGQIIRTVREDSEPAAFEAPPGPAALTQNAGDDDDQAGFWSGD